MREVDKPMTQWIRMAVILILIGGVPAGVHAQQIEQRHAAWSEVSMPVVELSWLDHRSIQPRGSHELQEGLPMLQEPSMTSQKLSWWKYPLIGAVAGGLTFTYITYRECQKEDCIFPVGLPLVGVALGAAGGLAVEGIIRIVK
jgi:hypothetical protein